MGQDEIDEAIKQLQIAAIKRFQDSSEKPIIKHQEKKLLQCVCGYTVEDQEMDLLSHACPLADITSILKTNSDSFGGILFEKSTRLFRRLRTAYSMVLRDDQQVTSDSHEDKQNCFAIFIEFVVWATKPPFEISKKRRADHRPLRDLFHTFLTTEYAQITQLEPTIFTPSTYYEDNYLLDTWEEYTNSKGEVYYLPLTYHGEPPPSNCLETGLTPVKKRAFGIVTLRQIARLWKGLWDDEWTNLENSIKTLDMSNLLLTRDLLFNNFLYWIISVPLDKEHPVPLWNMVSDWRNDLRKLYYQKNYLSFLCHTDTLKLRKVKWSEDMVDPPEQFSLHVGQQEHWYCDYCRNEDSDIQY